MEIKTIGDWTCKKCGTHLTLKRKSLVCDSCQHEATLEELFGQDDKNVYFNSNY